MRKILALIILCVACISCSDNENNNNTEDVDVAKVVGDYTGTMSMSVNGTITAELADPTTTISVTKVDTDVILVSLPAIECVSPVAKSLIAVSGNAIVEVDTNGDYIYSGEFVSTDDVYTADFDGRFVDGEMEFDITYTNIVGMPTTLQLAGTFSGSKE